MLQYQTCSSISNCLAPALTQLCPVYPNDAQCICRFPAGKKKSYRTSPECRLPIIAYDIGYFKCHPSLSPLTGMRHLHPDCWVKKWAVQDFIFGFTFSQLPPFSLSLGVGRSDTSLSSYTCAEHLEPLSTPNRTVALQQTDGKYFLQPEKSIHPSSAEMLLRRIR